MSSTWTSSSTRRPPPLPLSLSEPGVPINRFPSPPPVPMPPFTFPLAEGSASPLAALDQKHFNLINGEDEQSSASSSRSSSRKSSVSGGQGERYAMTSKRDLRIDSKITVPAITLTPPQAPSAYPILKSYSIDNPFLPKQIQPILPGRPSLLSFSSFSPSKRLRRKTARRMSDEEEAEESVEGLTPPRGVQQPKRSFSLPLSINTALDWALSTSSSAPNSPTKHYAKSVAELDKLKCQAAESGFNLPHILPTGPSSLFSPPPSATSVFSFANLSNREKKAVPAYSSRRRANRSPLLILLFPVFVVALHVYFSFVDVRFMHLGHDLVFGSPLAHRHTYAEGLHLDMHEAWSQFEEKISFQKRAAVGGEIDGDAPQLNQGEEDGTAEGEHDVVAFLRSMQEAADRGQST